MGKNLPLTATADAEMVHLNLSQCGLKYLFLLTQKHPSLTLNPWGEKTLINALSAFLCKTKPLSCWQLRYLLLYFL